MRIGFYLKWDRRGTKAPEGQNIIGDEFVAEAIAKNLALIPGITQVQLYTPSVQPSTPVDVMVYFNDTAPIHSLARHHVLYFQNFYPEGSASVLERLYTYGYDGYAFFSQKLLEHHQSTGRTGIFLPTSVDPTIFYPRPIDSRFAFDVAYIGNDIKGEDRTVRFILPGADFKFGLWGNWRLPSENPAPPFWKFKKLLRYRQAVAAIRPYQKTLRPWSLGNLDNRDMPSVCSSSKILLNCSAQDNIEYGVITFRTWEVLSCGGFLLTDAAYPATDGGVVVTTGGDDLREKIRYYLSHDSERLAIAARGLECARRHAGPSLTSASLAAYLFQIVGKR